VLATFDWRCCQHYWRSVYNSFKFTAQLASQPQLVVTATICVANRPQPSPVTNTMLRFYLGDGRYIFAMVLFAYFKLFLLENVPSTHNRLLRRICNVSMFRFICKVKVSLLSFDCGWAKNKPVDFYRAMHFSAKRGIAIACRLSVCLSVCLSVTLVDCDHIGWNSSTIISPLVSPGRSLFATPTWRVCSKENTLNLGPKWPTPLLIWASETFDRKLRPNGYR